ncbi:MAG: STAS domain-containing protein [Puniceicoccales bacterium]|jgi:SulP family sulfate permease|nr:STAS domain-containing protein [Puniceicoccales bacterium]
MLIEGLRALRPAKFNPRIFAALRGYNRTFFFKDVMAGIAVGIVALSLCVGLGVASGGTPQQGLYAGIIGGFCVSFFGGSRVQIGGPAGAFVGLMALLFAKYEPGDVLLCVMLAGVFLFLMGLARVGSFIRFVPQPVTVGFTCGIAVTILLTQVKAFLGLTLSTADGKEPPEFFQKIPALFEALPTISWATFALGAVLLTVQLRWPARWNRVVPGSIVTVVLGTLVVSAATAPWLVGQIPALAQLQFATIGSVFGEIPRDLPVFSFPQVEWSRLGDLLSPAFTIAILCALESLLSAVVADGIIDDRHDSNQELMGQGIANILSPLFGGLAVTGVIARTATNIRSGAASPVAGLIHAVFLLLVLLLLAPLAKNIPLVTLAVVLIVVGWRMGDWQEFRRLPKHAVGDAAVFLATFGLTVCFDLTLAVSVGMVLAAGLFVKRVTDATRVDAMSGETIQRQSGAKLDLPDGVIVYHLFGALMFGAADRLDTVLRREMRDIKVVILHMVDVTALDSTALERMENMRQKLLTSKRHLLLCGPHTQPFALMAREGFFDLVGDDNVVGDLPKAIERAKVLMNPENRV